MSENEEDFVMAFQDSCDKPALLLIHGFPLSSQMWEPQLDDLADFVRVVAPDLRGHGHSDSVPGPYSISQLADDCADLLGHLNVATPFVVCGLSMGGYIALEFYRRYPEHVAGLILAATRAGADSAEGKAGRDKAAELAKTEGATAVSAGMLPKMLAPQNYEADEELVDYVKEIVSTASLNGVVGALAAMRDRIDSTPMLGDIEVPVLILHGADDKLIPVSEAELMHKAIPNSELVVIPEAGHLPNLEQPDIFNDAVIDFLEELFGEEEED
ncbi:MAG: alpha/beta fold hydrolase [Ardenticatenaceae bacterium]|nr:alpha/beta fold hydrolase [Anaerolineales bacterium]MCB9007175.1 alpha/beta fold hydrolase [Ardenticatenaceae bacterium]